MRRAIIGLVAAALAAGAAQAKTVMWYRFEEQAPLTSTAAGVYVTNSVAATYPAHPRTINGTTYNDNNETTPMAGYLPTYTNSAPAGYCVYDPVTGTRVENRCGLHFHTTGSGDKNGGMLRITEDAEMNAITNLTLEAFVRLGPDVPITGSYMRPIILKSYQNFQGTWGLHVFESNLFYRATYVLNDGSKLSQAWGNGSKKARIDDGRWHHLAVTFDFGAKRVIAYVDYVQISAAPINADAVGFYHPASSPLQIGGNELHSTRRHNGEIDEVRISDEALPPEKFLRYIPMREIDADTMYYLSFEDGAADWFSAAAAPLNASTNALGNVTVERYAGTDPASATNDVPGASIRDSIYAPESVTNKSAVHLPVTAVGAHNGVSFLLTDPNNLVTASNFTFEAFIKTDRQTTKPENSQYADSFSIFYSGYMKVLMNGANKQLLFRYIVSGNSNESYVPRIDDGRWHHIAYVHDAAAGTITGYVDYKQVTSFVGGTGGHAVNIRISGESAGYQTLPGCLDEVRITRRALSPAEFLTTHDCVTLPTLAHADFEDGMDLSPDTGLIGAGVASARTGGSVPVLDDAVPGRIAMDGEAMQDVRDNRKSLRVEGGKIGWTDIALLRQPTFTVEFFAKLEHLDSVANLIRLTRGESPDGTPAWALFTFAQGTADQLTICAQKGEGDPFYFPAHNFSASIADGRWHHWALTFDSTSGTQTVITLYRDYQPLCTRTLESPLNYLNTVNTLSIGGTGSNPAHLRGNFDELRVSAGVLPVSAFMRAQPNGTALIVR